MQSNILAPWAEPVPNAQFPMRVDDLASLPDDNWIYEIVDGRLVRMPGSGSEASRIAINLILALGPFVKLHKLGDVTGPDGTYDLTLPGDQYATALTPDVAYVRAGRLAAMGTPEAKKYAKVAPDLAAEIVSPSQYHPEMDAKARLFLARGVRLVWVIWPTAQEVDVWRPGSMTPVATLHANDTLDGLDVLPGFTLPVAELFS